MKLVIRDEAWVARIAARNVERDAAYEDGVYEGEFYESLGFTINQRMGRSV